MMTERQIDEILAASFPASDPPSWTLGVETGRTPEKASSKPVRIEPERKPAKREHRG